MADHVMQLLFTGVSQPPLSFGAVKVTANAHTGAVDVSNKKCEDCELKAPRFGLPSEGKKRWCAGCAKAHVGAVGDGKGGQAARAAAEAEAAGEGEVRALA
jgi:hypothetical protein